MSDGMVSLQPAFILQHRPYRESSLLLEVFTLDTGIVTLLAKGVRKEKSRMAGLLLPFSLLRISYLGRHELKTLQAVECVESYQLQRLALYCGFYVNELLQRFVHRFDPHQALFLGYQHCLQKLAGNASIEQTLRYFELLLLEESGFGIDLSMDYRAGSPVLPDARYVFQPGAGLLQDGRGLICGSTLLALAAKTDLNDHQLPEAKLLLRSMLDVHLQGKPLKSRQVLGNIIKRL